MKLCIHYGVYKAGSSYIQHLCYINRSGLQIQGFHFPQSPEDDKMNEGLISRGNIHNLDLYLWNQQVKEIQNLFQKWIREAKRDNCHSVLISGESLTHMLSLKRTLHILIDRAKAAGFKSIEAMGFFRPIVDHALSTYKHRAKSGKHANPEKWIMQMYEAPIWLHRLYDRLQEKHDIRFHFRLFKKNNEWMKQCFFEDWLEARNIIEKGLNKVNVSLTLSEIKVMHLHRMEFPYTYDSLLKQFQSLPSKKKAKDKVLEQKTCNIFIRHLKAFEGLLINLSLYFPKEERKTFSKIGADYSDSESSSIEITLSIDQLMLIYSSLRRQRSPQAKWSVLKRKYLLPLYKLLNGKQNRHLQLSEMYPQDGQTSIGRENR